jgi:hypothetical protein
MRERRARASISQREDPANLHSWEFSVELQDVSCQAAEGCPSCLLLRTAVELLTVKSEFQNRDLGLTVKFCKGYILQGDLYTLLPEHQRDAGFSFGGGRVMGALASTFDSLINSFELYTLPGIY